MRLCVFCGSKSGNKDEYRIAATTVGAALARRGVELVYGGGQVGLMGVVADACLANGGKVIGVIPRDLSQREIMHHGLTTLEVVESMHQRKARMAELSDAFLAIPGGYGTLDELFEITTWAQLRLHHKPIGLLNIDGFFTALIAWMDHALAEGFLHERHRRLVDVDHCPNDLLDRLLQRAADEPAGHG